MDISKLATSALPATTPPRRLSQYRPDVDGLRAIAVLLVIAFHLDIAPITGGFIGVDVFFVISGYLFGALVIAQISSRSFNYKNYLMRRLWRLGPAATVVTALTSAGALYLLSPPDIPRMLKSALHSLAGASNVRFWREADYFDEAAITKPLLHTWSLAVEFQFYLAFPLAVAIFLFLVPKPKRLLVGALLLVVSFALSVAWVSVAPAGAYFLPPARMFEFGIGVMVSQLRFDRLGDRTTTLLRFTGLTVILACSLAYRPSTSFPGFAALLPTFGAALVIVSGERTPAASVLSSKVLTYIGKISYSLYLVHWPLIVFATTVRGQLSAGDKAAIICTALVLSCLLFYAVEQPLRRPNTRQQRIAMVSVAVTAAIIVGLLNIGDRAWSWRFSRELLAFTDPAKIPAAKEATWARIRALNLPFTTDLKPKVLLIGDSQGGDFTNIVEAAFGDAIELRTMPSSSVCLSMANPEYYRTSEKVSDFCLDLHSKYLSDGRIERADVVIMAFNWMPDAIPYFQESLETMKEAGARRILVVGSKELQASPLRVASRVGTLRNFNQVSIENTPRAVTVNEYLEHADGDFEFVNIMRAVCPKDDECLFVTDDGKSVFYDHVHFTLDGAALLAKSPEILKLELDRPAGKAGQQ